MYEGMLNQGGSALSYTPETNTTLKKKKICKKTLKKIVKKKIA